MDDLVSGVLTRLDVLESMARDAQLARGSGDWRVVSGPRRWDVPEVDSEIHAGAQSIARLSAEYGGYFHALHVVEHDPSAVLRLCRAHRQIVRRYEHAKDRSQNAPEAERLLWHARTIAFIDVIDELAVGLGVVEEDR